MDPDQVQRFVEPGLGLNCLQRVSADATNRQRVCAFPTMSPAVSLLMYFDGIYCKQCGT